MSNWRLPALGATTLLAAGLMAGHGGVKADDEPNVLERKIELRIGGGKLGVRLAELQKNDLARLHLTTERGALVQSVEEGSAAEKAGLKEGDVIVGYDGEAVRSAAQLARLVHETPGGRTVSIEVSRDGARSKLAATLSEGAGPFQRLEGLNLAESFPMALPRVAPLMKGKGFRFDEGEGPQFMFRRLHPGPGKLGVHYQEVSGQLAQYFKLKNESGVLVTSVDEDGPAGKAGMKAGDVVVSFGGKSIDDGEDFQAAVGAAEPGQEVAVTVQRDGRPVELKVQLAGAAERRRGARGVAL
jgi:serine protease Do